MFTGVELGNLISEVFTLHQMFPKKPSNAFRRFDGKTPYGVHPTLCGVLILQEDTMAEADRVRRAKALFGHDLKEDTTANLPLWCNDPGVMELIDGLTFSEGEDPFIEMWKRGEEVILVKFYDSVANLLATKAMQPERRQIRRNNVLMHLTHIESMYPELEIVKIAIGLLG